MALKPSFCPICGSADLKEFSVGQSSVSGYRCSSLSKLEPLLSAVIDDTPGFAGNYVPGTSLQIQDNSILLSDQIQLVVNLAPTHADVIAKKVPPSISFYDPISSLSV